DLARWLLDGNIEFLGRIDHQVKIRGFRIELGEIEHGLKHHHNVKEAVVIDKTDKTGEKYLCAYIVFRDSNFIDHSELKTYLSQTLPKYMIPVHFVTIEKIPLNPNGKVNRHKLPEPGAKIESKYMAPGSDSEQKIAHVWEKVLGTNRISIDENFFDAGGNSLKIIKLAIELNKHLEMEIPVAKFFQYPTIASQAKYIDQFDKEKNEKENTVLETDKVKNKLKQRRNKIRS
ncbi:MAG: phosphopantetheine-binding protein, partial [Acidobacteria bacterium]|nr:phosphopantetheine-binding protein [Acidobacteriota bacterium]